MATKKFVKEQMMRLEQNYGKDRFKITLELFNLWYEMFKDCAEEGLKVSVDEYLRTSEYPPTIASIMNIYKSKSEYRKEISEYLKNRYVWVCRWIDECPTQETYRLLCRYIFKFPKEERKKQVEELIRKAMIYYNETQENKPFKDWLEE